ENAHLEAVSASGDLAVVLRPEPGGGTLARVPGVGGVPRELAENISSADWDPEGTNLAVVRQTAAGSQVEYPIGTTLYRSNHLLSQVRVSPKGHRVAFLEYANPAPDAAGDVAVVEPGHPKRILIESWGVLTGLAWTPSGDELWFGGDQKATEHPG